MTFVLYKGRPFQKKPKIEVAMDPERDRLAAEQIRNHVRKHDRRVTRKHTGAYDDLKSRVVRLEAVVAEQAVIIQALIDRRAS